MEVFKCFHGMNPMYLNNLFCKQKIKYDLRDKTLLEQPKFSTKTYGYRSFKYYGSKLWNDLPFEIKNTENYDEFKLRLTTWCHSSDLEKLEIFWFSFFSFWLNCHPYPSCQGSRSQHLLLGIIIITVIITIIPLLWWQFILHPNVLEWVSSDLFCYFKWHFYLCIWVCVIEVIIIHTNFMFSCKF